MIDTLLAATALEHDLYLELVEVTPGTVRHLDPHKGKRSERRVGSEAA